MEVLLQRIESVSQPQGLSRLVFVGVVAQQPAVPLAPHAPGQIIDSLVMTVPDAEAAAFKVNGIYDLSLAPKA